MSQPIPIEKFSVNLLRVQVPTDPQHPNGESVIMECTPIDNPAAKVWLLLSPQETIDLGKGLIAEGELARTGLVVPTNW